MASHKRNGSTRPSAKELQRDRDRVALADQPTTEAALVSSQPPADPFKSGTTDAQGVPATGSRWAHINPAEAPPPGSRPSLIDKDTALKIYGVSGTPLTSAFLLDLGEYNPLLMGRNAIPTYEKMRRSDDMVSATLSVYRQPLMTAKWEVVEPEPGESGPAVSSNGAGKPTAAKAKEITRFVRENLFGGLEYQTSMGSWASQSWSSVIYNATLMLDFGCAIHEDVWRVDGNYLRIRNLPQRLPLTYYRWHVDPDGETLIALEQYGYRGNRFENVTIPIEKLCRFTYRQEGANFFGMGLSRALYSAWFYKDRFRRIWAVAAEKNMLGVPVWRLVPGFSKEDRDAAFKFVTGLCANELTGAVEPPQPGSDNKDVKSGFRFEIPQAARGNMQSIMQAVTYYDISMARAGLAMFMSSGNTPFGSRSTTKEHADFFLLALQGVADQMRWEIQCSTLRRLVWYNFGQDAPMPQLEVANVQARQLEDMADLLQRLGLSGSVVSDQGLRDYIRKEMALPKETREGLVAVKGETIDVGAPGGPEVEGKGAQPIGGAQRPPQAIMRDSLYYPLRSEDLRDARFTSLDTGDQFRLSRPMRFTKRKPEGPALQVIGSLSSNDWLKGRFQVRAKEGGVLLADHIAEEA